MFLGMLLTVVLSAIAAAQDVVKVSPETHKVLLENARIRVLDVHVKPGEHVAMHSHPAGILYYLSDATTHAVQNIGATELHEVHTEMKGVRAERD
jgi:quercetin dioxygenase-like cupin family protein